MPRKPGKHALAFIFVTILIDTIGLGIIIPVMPKLIMELTGDGLADAALYGGWLMFLYAALQFIMAPVIGNLSDRFGRRPVLLFALAALSIDYLILALAPTIVWLFIGRAGAGIAGASYTTANAYIADVTSPEKRAQSFGLVGAAFGIGFIVGPAMGGLLGEYGARLPFYAAAGLALLNVIYGYFVLPETLSKDKRRPFSLKRANPVGAIKQMWRYPLVIGLIAALLLHQMLMTPTRPCGPITPSRSSPGRRSILGCPWPSWASWWRSSRAASSASSFRASAKKTRSISALSSAAWAFSVLPSRPRAG